MTQCDTVALSIQYLGLPPPGMFRLHGISQLMWRVSLNIKAFVALKSTHSSSLNKFGIIPFSYTICINIIIDINLVSPFLSMKVK